MAQPSYLRASDADRDAVAERLRRAAVEGRLQPEELEERLHAALRARTYGDRVPVGIRRPEVGGLGHLVALTVQVELEPHRKRRGNCLMIPPLSMSAISRMCWWIAS